MTESAHAPSPFQRILQVGSQRYRYYALPAAYAELGDLSRLPFALCPEDCAGKPIAPRGR